MIENLIGLVGLGLILYGVAVSVLPRVYSFVGRLKSPGDPKPQHDSLALPVIAIALGAIILVVNTSWFMAERGKYYVAQNILGKQRGIVDTGPTWNLLGTVRPYDRLMTVRFAGFKDGEIETSAGTREEGEGSTRRIKWRVPDGAHPPVECRFADGVLAWVQGTYNFPMPASAEKLVALGNEFTSNQAFVEGVALPAVQEIVRVACRMTTAQDYYSGNAGALESAIKEMLSQGGTYVVEVKTEVLPEQTNASAALNVQIDRPDNVRYTSEIRKDAQGKILATPLKLGEYHISPSASITDVTPEPKFELRLARVRDKAAERNLARQDIALAQEQERANTARGLAELAKRNAELKLKQAEQVVGAETEAKKASEEKKQAETEAEKRKSVAAIDRDTADINLAKAKLTAEATKATADADAYRQRELAAATGNLDQRLATYEAVMKAAFESIKGQAVVPQITMGGNSNGSTGTPTSIDTVFALIGAQAAKDLLEGKPVVPAQLPRPATVPASNR